MTRKVVLVVVSALLVLVVAVYTWLVTPRRFVQCLPATLQYFTRDFEPLTGRPGRVQPATQVQLLVNGDEALPAMLDLIAGAEESIRWQVMLFKPDEAGQELADALAQAARRGVQVQLSFNIDQTVNGTIADRMPEAEKTHNQRRMEAMLAVLREAGVAVRDNRPTIDFDLSGVRPEARAIQEDIRRNACVSDNHYDHRKLIVVDNRRAWVGGMNVGEHYLFHQPLEPTQDMVAEARQRALAGQPEPWQKWFDAAILLEGPVVAELAAAFDWKWDVLGGQPSHEDAAAGPVAAEAQSTDRKAAGVPVEVLEQRPGDWQIGERYLELVNQAQREIWVASPFVSYGPVLEALQAASRRGVRVVFVYPYARQESQVSRQVFRHYVDALVASGVELYFNDLRMGHTKLLVVDGQQVLVGSFNLNHRSFRHDLEIATLVDDERLAGEVIDRVFGPYLANSRRVVEPIRVPFNLIDWFLEPFT